MDFPQNPHVVFYPPVTLFAHQTYKPRFRAEKSEDLGIWLECHLVDAQLSLLPPNSSALLPWDNHWTHHGGPGKQVAGLWKAEVWDVYVQQLEPLKWCKRVYNDQKKNTLHTPRTPTHMKIHLHPVPLQKEKNTSNNRKGTVFIDTQALYI